MKKIIISIIAGIAAMTVNYASAQKIDTKLIKDITVNKNFIVENTVSHEFHQFKYDSLKRIICVDTKKSGKTNYKYLNDKLECYVTMDGYPFLLFTAELDSTQKKVCSFGKIDNDQMAQKTMIEYDNNNFIKSQTDPEFVSNYVWENGNLISFNDKDYEYSFKYNNNQSLINFNVITFSTIDCFLITLKGNENANLIKEFTVKDKNDGLTFKYVISYEFDKDNYPTKIIMAEKSQKEVKTQYIINYY